MIGQLIHGRIKCRHMKCPHMSLHSPNKGITVSIKVIPALITVLLHARQEPGQRFHKGIVVHNRIPLIPLQPALRISVMLCQNDRIGICLLYSFPEILPELMVKFVAVPKICRHIQSPSIYIIRRRNPLLTNLQNLIIQIPGGFIIQLRQSIMSPPSIIGRIVRPAVLVIEIKVIPIWTVCRNIRSLWISLLVLIDPLSVHPFVKRSTMVKHTIQDYFHASLMDFLHKLCKQFITCLQIPLIGHTLNKFPGMGILAVPLIQKAIIHILHDLAVMGIHILIILNIVLVITWRNKNRVQINNIHSQILQIIQFIHNSLQVTAIKLPHPHYCRNFSPVSYPGSHIANIKIFTILHIIRRIPIAEAIHKNLVHNSTLRPLGCIIIRINLKLQTLLRVHGNTLIIIITGHPSVCDLKMVTDNLLSHNNRSLIIIKSIGFGHTLHLLTLAIVY